MIEPGNEKTKLPPENVGGSKVGTESLAGTALGGRSALVNGYNFAMRFAMEIINDFSSKVDVKMFASGLTIAMVETPSGCKVKFELPGVERHALTSGVYSRTTEENEKLIKIAQDAADAATALLSEINKKLSEGDFKL